MSKPYVICHMTSSIDGKTTGKFLESSAGKKASDVYYKLHRQYDGDGFACGRITMNESFVHNNKPDTSIYQGRKMTRNDYIADEDAVYFAVSFDTKGSLYWKKGTISDPDEGYDDSHVIEVLSENVKDEFLVYLRSVGVSYIFAGKNEIDVSVALEKLYDLFGIKKLLLEGGSKLNGSFLKAGLVNELSLVIANTLQGEEGLPIFEGGKDVSFDLKPSEVNGVIVLHGFSSAKSSFDRVSLSEVIDNLQDLQSDDDKYYYNKLTKKFIFLNPNPLIMNHKEYEDLCREIEDDEHSNFVALYDRREVDEYGMMEDYIYEKAPEKLVSLLQNALGGRGAFRRFREILRNNGLEDDWYDYRDEKYKELAIYWCKENDLIYF